MKGGYQLFEYDFIYEDGEDLTADSITRRIENLDISTGKPLYLKVTIYPNKERTRGKTNYLLFSECVKDINLGVFYYNSVVTAYKGYNNNGVVNTAFNVGYNATVRKLTLTISKLEE